MQAALRRNAFLVAGLAVFFWWAFGFAKHDPVLRKIVPFGEDPYDAVSSFGAIAAVLLALISFLRSYFPQWVGRGGQPIYILRTQATVPFCVLVTVAAEVVAMKRHSSTWVGTPGSTRLLALEAVLAGIALIALAFIRVERFQNRSLFARASVIWLATLLILAIYPEQLISKTPGHLLTVVLSDVFLFAPVSAMVKAWLPGTPVAATTNRGRGNCEKRFTAFAAAAAVGLIIGALAYFAEVSEDSVRPAFAQMLFVGSIFVGLGVSGMVIGYAFLGRLLGFVVDEPAVS